MDFKNRGHSPPPVIGGCGSRSSFPALELDEIHVWSRSIDSIASSRLVESSDFERLKCEDHLSVDELARARRLINVAAQRRFIYSRVFLRLLLGGYLSVDPKSIVFGAETLGKPTVTQPEEARLQFNLSHSRDRLLVAVSRNRRLGVDVEHVRPLESMPSLVRRCFSEFEQSQFESLAEADRLPGFFRTWTRKEAYLKATGDGLTFPLKGVEFNNPLQPARLRSVEGRPLETERWNCVDLQPAEAYVGTLVHEGSHCVVNMY